MPGSSSWPTSNDSFPTTRPDTALTGPDVLNHAAALNNLQSELGLNPSGSEATVAARLAALAAGSTAPLVVSAGNLGSAYTLTLDAARETWLVGTLNANVTITVAGLAAGARAKLFLTQDATGSRTVTLSSGGTVTPTVNPVASSLTEVYVDAVDSTNLNVLVPGAPGPPGPAGAPGTSAFVADPWAIGGAKHETIARANIETNGSILVSGRINIVGGVTLKAGITYSGVAFYSGGTAVATPTHQWFGIAKQSDRTFVRLTVNDTTAAWAANTVKRLALTSSYTPSADLPVYLVVMVAATTVPTLNGKSVVSGTVNFATPAFSGSSDSGYTTPPAEGASFTALSGGSSVIPYAYVD